MEIIVSVYDRPMFKKGGGAIGIMASGPELMKRFSNGGFNFIPTASASPVFDWCEKCNTTECYYRR